MSFKKKTILNDKNRSMHTCKYYVFFNILLLGTYKWAHILRVAGYIPDSALVRFKLCNTFQIMTTPKCGCNFCKKNHTDSHRKTPNNYKSGHAFIPFNCLRTFISVYCFADAIIKIK